MTRTIARSVYPAVVLLSAVTFPRLSAGQTPEECAVWRRELSFAQSVENHDSKVFAAHLHPGGIFNAGSRAPLRGPAAIVENWSGLIEGKGILLRWRPGVVNIGGDPNIAFSSGPYTIEDPAIDGKNKYLAGIFTSVWVKDSGGEWRVLFDGGGQRAAPVENAEAARKFMAQAPDSCPAR